MFNYVNYADNYEYTVLTMMTLVTMGTILTMANISIVVSYEIHKDASIMYAKKS